MLWPHKYVTGNKSTVVQALRGRALKLFRDLDTTSEIGMLRNCRAKVTAHSAVNVLLKYWVLGFAVLQ